MVCVRVCVFAREGWQGWSNSSYGFKPVAVWLALQVSAGIRRELRQGGGRGGRSILGAHP